VVTIALKNTEIWNKIKALEAEVAEAKAREAEAKAREAEDKEYKARVKFCSDLRGKSADLNSSFFNRVKALNFTPREYSEDQLASYIGNILSRESSGHAERLRVKCEKQCSGSQRSLKLSEFRPRNLDETEYAMEVKDLTLRDQAIKDILLSSFFQFNEETMNTFLDKWAHFVGEVREIVIFHIQKMQGGFPEYEVSFTQPLLLLLLRSISDDLHLRPDCLEIDGTTRTIQLLNLPNVTKLTGVLDLARTSSDKNIEHHYEVKRSHTALAEVEANATREQLMGQNLLLSLCLDEKKELIRGLCTDLFVSSTCWYKPTREGYGGTQFVEKRIMEPMPFVLRLVLSLLDLDDQQLCSMMEVKPDVKSEEDTKGDGDEDKDDKKVEPKPPPHRNKKPSSKLFSGSGGVTGGEMDTESIVLWCGRDETENYSRELTELRKFSRILQGEVPLTAESLKENENQMMESIVPADPLKRMMLGNNRKLLGVIDGNLNR
jgi:hypothetical protein